MERITLNMNEIEKLPSSLFYNGGGEYPTQLTLTVAKRKEPDRRGNDLMVYALVPTADEHGNPAKLRVYVGSGKTFTEKQWGTPDGGKEI